MWRLAALQLNPHGHLLVPDDVFGARFENAPGSAPAFHRIAAPDDQEVRGILLRIAGKALALAERLGLRDRPLSEESIALARTIGMALPAKAAPVERWHTTRRSAFYRGFPYAAPPLFLD